MYSFDIFPFWWGPGVRLNRLNAPNHPPNFTLSVQPFSLTFFIQKVIILFNHHGSHHRGQLAGVIQTVPSMEVILCAVLSLVYRL